MDEHKRIIWRMRSQTFPILIGVAFLGVFGLFWGVGVWVATDGVEKIFAFVPLAMQAFVLTAFIVQFTKYKRAIKALKYGEEGTAEVLSIESSYSNNTSNMRAIKVRYTSFGTTIVAKTMHCYFAGEASELQQKGSIKIKYFKKGFFIIEGFEEQHSALSDYRRKLEGGGREWEHEYNYQRENRAKEKTPSQAKRVVVLDEELRRVADMGVPYASDLIKLSTSYERLRFCALNEVVGEAREALESDLGHMTNDQHIAESINWYRGLRQDIATLSLEDAIKLVDFFDYFLEGDETADAIGLVLEKSKDVEPYMLASRTVRKLKQYKSVLEIGEEIKKNNGDVYAITNIITSRQQDFGNLLGYIGAVARVNVASASDKKKISQTLADLGGE